MSQSQQQHQISPTRPVPLPQIVDAYSLVRAIQLDPEQTFEKLRVIIAERDQLRKDVHSLADDYRNVRADYNSARASYEKLSEIWTQKQFLLWKFVERIRNGEEGVNTSDDIVGGGEWKCEGKGDLTGQEVEEMWSMHGERMVIVGSADNTEEPESEEPEERGRSRVAKRQQSLEMMESEIVSLTTEESFCESVAAESGDSVLVKLDPSAVSS